MSHHSRTPLVNDKRAFMYARVSDPSQASIPSQVAWARSFADENGITILWERDDTPFQDHGVQGDTLVRPGLTRLECAFKEHHRARCPVSRLIVWHVDRLSRADSLDAFAELAVLRQSGLRYIHTHGRTYDLDNALDRTLLAIEQDHKNNPFLVDHGSKALRGMCDVAVGGFWVGRVPLGYRLVKVPGMHKGGTRRRSGRLAINEEIAPIVRELFERYDRGESTTDLAKWLSSKVRPPKAGLWSAQTIRQLLMNEVYIGTRIFGRRARGEHVRLQNGQPVEQDKDAGEDNIEGALVIPKVLPVLVDPGLFRRVQDLLAGGRRRGFHKQTEPLPLSGLGTCGHCEGPLHATMAYVSHRSGKKTRTRRLVCANRHRYGAQACADGSTGCPHDEVLRIVLKLLSDNLVADGALERITQKAEERAGEERRQRQELQDTLMRRLGQLDEAIARSQRRLVECDDDTLADCQAGLRQVKADRAEVVAELARLQEQSATRPTVDPERFREFWNLAREATEVKIGSEGTGKLNRLLGHLIVGFKVTFKRDKHQRATLDRVDVELPRWLSELASSAFQT